MEYSKMFFGKLIILFSIKSLLQKTKVRHENKAFIQERTSLAKTQETPRHHYNGKLGLRFKNSDYTSKLRINYQNFGITHLNFGSHI